MRDGWCVLKKMAQAERQGLMVGHPAALTREWLMRCLKRNAHSNYGKRYGFAEIRTAEEYRERVPLVGYEDITDCVQKVMDGVSDELFVGKIVAFESTGGSSGGKKWIPYSSHSLFDFRAAILPWLGDLIERYRMGLGRAYWAISPVLREQRDVNGVPLGMSDGGYLGEDIALAFDSMSAVDASVGLLSNLEEWRLETLTDLLRAVDLEFVSVWSPTFFLHLLDAIEENRRALKQRFSQEKEALYRLDLYRDSGFSELCGLWPNLKLISCWRDAGSAYYARELEKRMNGVPLQGKGLLLTEGVVTTPGVEDVPLLSFQSGFFEFIDDRGNLHFMEDVVEGQMYEVVMSTAGGLYRYRAGDVVSCEGFKEEVPILRFVGRRSGVSDLVGEKLTDAFVSQCLENAECTGMLFPLLHKQSYALLTEQKGQLNAFLAERLDRELCSNPQYAYARKIGQLGPITLHFVSDLSALCCEKLSNAGQRLGDIKMPSLATPVIMRVMEGYFRAYGA